MKPSTLILLASLCAPTTLIGQELSKETTKSKPTKLVVGATVGLAESHHHYREIPDVGPAVGLFARNYIGKHLALESGLRYSTQGPLTVTSTDFNGIRRFTIKSVSIPLHLQYHLLSSESRIRPYFGIGLGLTRKYNNTVYNYNSAEETESSFVYNDAYIQFTQGLTWQISKNLQLNQAFYYQRNRMGNFGFELGLGYTIR